MKKTLKLLLALVLAVSLVACSSNNEPANTTAPEATEGTAQNDAVEEKITLGFVTDIGGIDDKSFNQTSYEGLKKAADELGLVDGTDYSYLQSAKDADYVPNLSSFAEEEVDLIVAAGFLFADSITSVANSYPDQKMLIIDVDWLDSPNVQQAVFAEHEGSFLVGVAAGLTAKNAGKTAVGFVQGQESVTMEKFWAGYQQGVWAVYPECEIYYDNADSFGSPESGKTLAAKQYNAGAYVVYHAAGATGNGVIAEAAERRAAGEDVWVCGVDTDQYDYGKYGDNGESAVLTSMLKRVDTAAYNAVMQVSKGEFKPGVVRYTLADNGVGLPEENPNLTEEILAEVDAYTQKIIDGEITVAETGVHKGDDARIK